MNQLGLSLMLLGSVLTSSLYANSFESIAVECYKEDTQKAVEIEGVEAFVFQVGKERSYPITCRNATESMNKVEYTLDKIYVLDAAGKRADITQQCGLDTTKTKALVIKIKESKEGFSCSVNQD